MKVLVALKRVADPDNANKDVCKVNVGISALCCCHRVLQRIAARESGSEGKRGGIERTEDHILVETPDLELYTTRVEIHRRIGIGV